MALSRNNSWCAPDSPEYKARQEMIKSPWKQLEPQDQVAFLDTMSRKRSLTLEESRGLERAMKRCGML